MNCKLINAVRTVSFILVAGVVILSAYGCSNSEKSPSSQAESVTEAVSDTPLATKTGQSADYTWEEYEQLDDTEKEQFYESFSSNEEFNLWMTEAKKKADSPWIKEGRNPKDYSWEEFEALTDTQKELFYDTFASNEDFDFWVSEAKKKADSPWIKEGRNPKDYTWEEFEALTDTQKELFYDAFESNEAFDEWMNKAKANN